MMGFHDQKEKRNKRASDVFTAQQEAVSSRHLYVTVSHGLGAPALV